MADVIVDNNFISFYHQRPTIHTAFVFGKKLNVIIKNNTVMGEDNSTSYFLNVLQQGTTYPTNISVINNIILDFQDIYHGVPSEDDDIVINYCCSSCEIPEEFLPEDYDHNNIFTDPMFVSEEAEDYHLTQFSPCIDAGDPDTDGDGSNWEIDEDDCDIDGSRKDIGCYPYIHDYDTKHFEGGIHWVSFPRLIEHGTDDNEIYQQAYYNNGLSGLLQATAIASPTIAGFEKINGRRDNENIAIVYNDGFGFHDADFGNMLFRHESYKIRINADANSSTLTVAGERLPPNYVINQNLDANQYHWLGYWLPESQNIKDALGDYWGNVRSVSAEDWYWFDGLPERNGEVCQAYSWKTEGKTMEYGKGYVIKFYEEIENFHWVNSGTIEIPYCKPKPEYFHYVEKAEYEVIDILDIPEDVLEIGVYQDNRCVGAVVTDEDAEQILVYSDRMNRDETVFTFQLVYGRSGAVPLNNYTVYDEKVGDYVKGNIVAGKQDYSIIRFEGGEPTDPPQVMQLLGNFPNPFTGETTINFSLSAENMKNAEIEIFNIKGQKVENLQITNSPNQQIIWNANNFANGVYFYKLVVDGIAVDTKKMILLK